MARGHAKTYKNTELKQQERSRVFEMKSKPVMTCSLDVLCSCYFNIHGRHERITLHYIVRFRDISSKLVLTQNRQLPKKEEEESLANYMVHTTTALTFFSYSEDLWNQLGTNKQREEKQILPVDQGDWHKSKHHLELSGREGPACWMEENRGQPEREKEKEGESNKN